MTSDMMTRSYRTSSAVETAFTCAPREPSHFGAPATRMTEQPPFAAAHESEAALFDPHYGTTVIDSGRLIESSSSAGLAVGSPACDVATFTHKLGTLGTRYGSRTLRSRTCAKHSRWRT